MAAVDRFFKRSDAPETVWESSVRYSVRTVLVGVIFAITLGVPSFTSMVALIGGLVCATMGYILPPIFYM
jgi:hypothetical protein